MLWLYNKDNLFDFYQIFIDNELVFNNNDKIYSFEPNLSINNKNFKYDLNEYKFEDVTFEIKIIDNIISYTNLLNDKINVFTYKMIFIEPLKNIYNLPIFNYSYKKVNKNRMPNLIESKYYLFLQLNLKIYRINDDIQFIIETNSKTNIQKKYFIVKDLKLLKNFYNKI